MEALEYLSNLKAQLIETEALVFTLEKQIKECEKILHPNNIGLSSAGDLMVQEYELAKLKKELKTEKKRIKNLHQEILHFRQVPLFNSFPVTVRTPDIF